MPEIQYVDLLSPRVVVLFPNSKQDSELGLGAHKDISDQPVKN
jgi:hypothetical protein